MSINHVTLHCFFISTTIILCSRSIFFYLLNLLLPGISLSIDDIYYLYQSTSVTQKTIAVNEKTCGDDQQNTLVKSKNLTINNSFAN
ncbi:unnamed protein product [Schistosoma bovis]|nr:unnamed protein product [Schistosoma bovis]